MAVIDLTAAIRNGNIILFDVNMRCMKRETVKTMVIEYVFNIPYPQNYYIIINIDCHLSKT